MVVKIKTKVIKYKYAVHLYKQGEVEIGGKKYKVHLIQAKIIGSPTSDLLMFTYGRDLYLVPEYTEIPISYYIAFKTAGIKTFEKDLAKIKITNPKKILKKVQIIESTNGVILAKIDNVVIIIKGKAIYTDPLKVEQLKELIAELKKT